MGRLHCGLPFRRPYRALSRPFAFDSVESYYEDCYIVKSNAPIRPNLLVLGAGYVNAAFYFDHAVLIGQARKGRRLRGCGWSRGSTNQIATKMLAASGILTTER